MTSTEFTIGLEGTRASSKVLRPPGGISSDIFGLGTRQYASSNTNGTGEMQANQVSTSNTQNRLFGAQAEAFTPTKTHARSNIFGTENPTIIKSTKKTYVRRNPITGEEIVMNRKNSEIENNTNEDNEDDTSENKQENDNEIKKIELPTKTVQTSIRIRNPPGGKSSGIF